MNVMSSATGKRLTEEDRETLEMLSVVLSAAVSHAAEFEARRAQGETLARFRTLFDGASIGIVRVGRRGRGGGGEPGGARRCWATAPTSWSASASATSCTPTTSSAASRASTSMMAGRPRLATSSSAATTARTASVIWGQSTAVLERDGEGQPRFVLSMIENITERKLAEQALVRAVGAEPAPGAARRRSPGSPTARCSASGSSRPSASAARDERRLAAAGDGPRPLQGGQRLARPPRRRRAAERGRAAASRARVRALGHRRAPGRRRVRDAAPGGRRPPEIIRPPSSASARRSSGPISVQGCRSRSRPRSASRSSRTTAPTSRRCCAARRRRDVLRQGGERSATPSTTRTLDNRDPTRLTLVGELRRAIERARAGAPLPAEGDARRPATIESVEALAALAAPRARPDLPRRVHPARPADRPDRAAHALRDRRGAAAVPRACSTPACALPVAVNLSTRNLLDPEFPDQVEALLAALGRRTSDCSASRSPSPR